MSNEKTYQIIVLGYSSIGHGALINRYVNNICEPGEVGREFWKKNILVDGHYEFFQIYDLICTCCRFGFSINYNEFQGIIIVYNYLFRIKGFLSSFLSGKISIIQINYIFIYDK